MKKGIILLTALIFTACVNLEELGVNTGGEVKEIKTTETNIKTSKNYEKRNGVLYVDNVLANGKQEYKERNGVIIKGNYREGLPDGIQEKYYPSGKIFGKINIINNKTEGTETNYYENGDLLSKIEGKKITVFYLSGKKLFTMDKSDIAVYHENGKEVFSNSDDGIKINGESAKKSLLDMFSKENLLKTALFLLTSDTVQATYKNGKPSIQLQGTTAVMYYESGKILLELSPSLDGTVNSKIYYENGQLMQVEDRTKSGRSVKVYDKAGNLISDTTYSKEHEIRQIF